MSYVAISPQVMEKLVREAREHPDEQVVGVLLGGQSGGTIMIEDAATGSAESDSSHATLTGESIAKIADDIINKRVRGSIVGWYHSHVRGGVFMSETDVETQLKLQQFSPQVTAMVIDAQTGTTGFFRADSKTKGSIPIRSEPLRIEAMAPSPALGPVAEAAYPQEYPQAPAPAPVSGPSTRTLILAVILITLAITGGIMALIYYAEPGAGGSGNLAIKHTSPPGPFIIAHAITLDANVTGSNLQNVTLAYRIFQSSPTGGLVIGDLVKVPMLLKAAGKDVYSYTIPGSEISGLYLYYWITAYDGSNNAVRTETYNLPVRSFDWKLDQTDEIVVTRTIPITVSIDLTSLNGFNLPVTIRVIGSPPAGASIRPVNNPVPGANPAQLQITTTKDSQIVRKDRILIEAVYSVAAVQITREVTLVLTVTDFADPDVNPKYLEVKPDKEATYTMKLTVYGGFTTPNGFQITISGLESLESVNKISWTLQQTSYKIKEDGTDEITYNLVFKTESGAKTGLYLFNVRITAATAGGNITHSADNIQLKIVT